MNTHVRPLPSLAAVLTISAIVLLGCSSSPAASPSPSSPTSAAIAVGSDDATADSSDAGPASVTGSSDAGSTSAGSGDAGEPSTGEPGTGSSDAGPTSGTASAGGAARIAVSGSVCAFLEKKIPIAEMATLTGLGVDRTVEMGDTWCVYGSSGPDDIVTVQYQKEAKSSFDLLGADGTPVDTTTLGVPMYSDQDLNGVYFLDGTTQWEVRVGNAGSGADPAKYAAAITVAQKLLG